MHLAIVPALMLITLAGPLSARAQIAAFVGTSGSQGGRGFPQDWTSDGGLVGILVLILVFAGVGGYLGARTTMGGALGAARGAMLAFSIVVVGAIIWRLL